jgi:hypothetical protein
MAAPKKPLVNWFSRTKEKSSEESDSTFNKKKKVTAPESKLSRGFTKTDSMAVSVKKPNDSTSVTSRYNSVVKNKIPNASGGGGTTSNVTKRQFVESGRSMSGSDSSSYNKNRNPSVARRGVSESIKSNLNSVTKDYTKPVKTTKDTLTESYSKKTTPKLKKK